MYRTFCSSSLPYLGLLVDNVYFRCRVSIYTFSPRTGLVAVHTVNSIHPAPHETVYDALRASLVKLRLTGPAGGGEKGAGAAISATAVEQSGMAVGESSGDPREIKPRS